MNHAVFTDPFGLFTITGGKLTTYRAMAEDLVDRVAADLGGVKGYGPCRTRAIPLGLHGSPAAAVRLARAEVAGWACRRGRRPGWCSATATTGGRRPG